MIRITTFDTQGNTLTFPVHNAKEAARIVENIAMKSRFLQITEDEWSLIWSTSVKIAFARLVHIIETHAKVNLQ